MRIHTILNSEINKKINENKLRCIINYMKKKDESEFMWKRRMVWYNS